MRVLFARRSVLLVIVGLLVAAAAALYSPPARAQSAAVTIMDFQFSPQTMTVAVGTTVTWTNHGPSAHTTTSDTGVWDSGTLAPGQSFSHTFNQPGTYPYHCAIHPFMKGTIVVQAAGASPTATSPPSVSTTTPTATSTSIPLAAYPVSAHTVGGSGMGPAHMTSEMAWLGYYDAHIDTYLSTDVSNKAQARAMHINYSAALGRTPMGATPALYLVKGRAVAGQLAVFGSEPGEANYSPIWHEVAVRWKAGVKPVLLVRDDQIASLAQKGKLTMRVTHVLVTFPIVKVGK